VVGHRTPGAAGHHAPGAASHRWRPPPLCCSPFPLILASLRSKGQRPPLPAFPSLHATLCCAPHLAAALLRCAAAGKRLLERLDVTSTSRALLRAPAHQGFSLSAIAEFSPLPPGAPLWSDRSSRPPASSLPPRAPLQPGSPRRPLPPHQCTLLRPLTGASPPRPCTIVNCISGEPPPPCFALASSIHRRPALGHCAAPPGCRLPGILAGRRRPAAMGEPSPASGVGCQPNADQPSNWARLKPVVGVGPHEL
jgi:hypothetical protein